MQRNVGGRADCCSTVHYLTNMRKGWSGGVEGVEPHKVFTQTCISMKEAEKKTPSVPHIVPYEIETVVR